MSRDGQQKIEFLVEHGASSRPHRGANLLEHLLGTKALLAEWGEREALCDAGLFHSVYGTESYAPAAVPLALRPRVRALIGDEAEGLAYFFGRMSKPSFYENLSREGDFALVCRLTGERVALSEGVLADLCHLVVANWLEQRPRAPAERRGLRRGEFEAMRRFLRAGACEALGRAYGFRSLGTVSGAGRERQGADGRATSGGGTADLVTLLQWPSEALVRAACDEHNGAHLRRVVAALRAAGGRPGPEAKALGELFVRLSGLDQSSYLRIVSAPETYAYAVGALREAEGVGGLAAFLDEAIEAEIGRAGAGGHRGRGVWSALGDVYLPPEEGAVASPDHSTTPAGPMGGGTFFEAYRVGEFSSFGERTFVDFFSPRARRDLRASAWRSYQFASASAFSPDERERVERRLRLAFDGLRRVAPPVAAFVANNLLVLIPRRDARNAFFKGSSCRDFVGRANLYNPHAEGIDETHVAQSVLHEAVHNYLFKVEEDAPLTDASLARASGGPTVASPWTGTGLDVCTLLHSAMVWYGLHSFFGRPEATRVFPAASVEWYRERAAVGYRRDGVTRCLRPYAAGIRAGVFEQVALMEERVQRGVTAA